MHFCSVSLSYRKAHVTVNNITSSSELQHDLVSQDLHEFKILSSSYRVINLLLYRQKASAL